MTIRERLQPGVKVQVFYGKKHPANGTLHIRAIVDDCFIVYRQWNRSKKSWMYEVSHYVGFEVMAKVAKVKISQ